MDSRKTSGEGAREKESRQLLSEQKDVGVASDYALSNVREMKELEQKFEDMGFFDLLWDSKVPDEDKSWLQFFFRPCSLKVTDKEEVKGVIRKYRALYEAMYTAMEKLKGKKSSETDDPFLITSELYELLNDMDRSAQSDKKTTDSSAISKLHKQFMEKHMKLENMVRRVESVASRDRIKTLTNLMENSKNMILEFQKVTQDLLRQKNEKEEEVRELVTTSKIMGEQLQSLMDVNAKLREDQKKLLSQCSDSNSRMENVEKLLKQLTGNNM